MDRYYFPSRQHSDICGYMTAAGAFVDQMCMRSGEQIFQQNFVRKTGRKFLRFAYIISYNASLRFCCCDDIHRLGEGLGRTERVRFRWVGGAGRGTRGAHRAGCTQPVSYLWVKGSFSKEGGPAGPGDLPFVLKGGRG